MTYRLGDLYTAIADPHRRQILDLLLNGELNIAEIASHFNISRTAVDKHINVLVSVDLVRANKVGRDRFHTLNPQPLELIWDWVEPYSHFWSNQLQRLKNNVERSSAINNDQ